MQGYLKVETSAKAYDIIVEHLEELEIPNAEIKKRKKKKYQYQITQNVFLFTKTAKKLNLKSIQMI